MHQAAQALRDRECDVAVAGAVNLIVDERTTREFTRFGMLSPTGRCRAFDTHADGFVRSEGAGAVVLKRLGDALREGDRILAVVRGSAVNQDGRSDGLSAPSAEAQEQVYRAALVRAGLDASEIGYVEAHGTGTRLGDPTELTSLTRVYGGQGRAVAIGSIKTNVGHLEPAAGIVGLIKTVLSLDYGLIPGNLHFTGWTPGTDPSAAGLFVPTGTTRWPDGAAVRRAAVSSFGFSGTNAHVVLEEAPNLPSAPAVPRPTVEPEVVVIPAGSRAALPDAATRVADWLDGDGRDVPLRDIAHTFALRRGAGRGRLGVVATAHRGTLGPAAGVRRRPRRPGRRRRRGARGVVRGAVWVFSGQGSQWAGMGRELLATEPAFAASLTRTDALITSEAGFSVLDVMRAGQPVAGCGFVQPVLFAIQVALADLWRSYGVDTGRRTRALDGRGGGRGRVRRAVPRRRRRGDLPAVGAARTDRRRRRHGQRRTRPLPGRGGTSPPPVPARWSPSRWSPRRPAPSSPATTNGCGCWSTPGTPRVSRSAWSPSTSRRTRRRSTRCSKTWRPP